MTDTPSADRAWMTPLLNRIADVAGERAALILATEKAAQLIYIPKTVTPDHWLSVLIGLDAAAKLAAAYGPKHITVPPAVNGSKRRRARLLADLTRKGYSINQITALTGVARSTVIEHRSKLPPSETEDDQQSLL